MNSEYINSSSSALDSLLEDVRKQGSTEISRPMFRLMLVVILVCSVSVSAIICHWGVDYIEENYARSSWVVALVALVLLSVFNGWVFFRMVGLSLTLWRMTKEE